jgi:hypothetical protein
VLSARINLIMQSGMAVSEQRKCAGDDVLMKMEKEFFDRIGKSNSSAVVVHYVKFSTWTCNKILVGRNLWDRYKATLHLIKNILMPAFKGAINDSGGNLQDALDRTRWAHWAFKTNAKSKIAKASAKKKEDDGSKTVPDGSERVPDGSERVPGGTLLLLVNKKGDDCPEKETYWFAEYESFCEYRDHPLLNREVSSGTQILKLFACTLRLIYLYCTTTTTR